MKRVLVAGAGQLSLMLAEAASRLGLQLDRLDPFTGKLYRGTSFEETTYELEALISNADVITAEIEHLPDNALVSRLFSAPHFPAVKALHCIADRLPQKKLLDELSIASAPWHLTDCASALDNAWQAFSGELVMKRRRGGYDGRGTLICRQGAAKPDADWIGDTIAEQCIPFQRELALVGARNANGAMVFYPLVENIHRNGILRVTLAPAQQVSAELQQQAEQALGKIMQALDYQGVMALECFDTGDGLLVNEIAPRVHNSGHWTQAGCDLCQFNLHLRALADLPLPTPSVFGPRAMVNLIGVPEADALRLSAGHRLHWYGKEPRPLRKVGHVNLEGHNADQLRVAALALENTLKATEL